MRRPHGNSIMETIILRNELALYVNYRLIAFLTAITGYVLDAVITFIFVVYLHTYTDVHTINDTVYGLLYTHLSVILLVSLLAFLLWLVEKYSAYFNKYTYYTAMAIIAVVLWFPDIENLKFLL